MVGYSIYGRKEIIGRQFLEKYTAEFNRRKLLDKVIINKKIITRVRKALKGIHQQTKENVRIIPDKDFYISGDTYIYNNIYAVNFWNKGEIVGVEIENPEIAKVQKSIFYSLWRRAKSLKNFPK